MNGLSPRARRTVVLAALMMLALAVRIREIDRLDLWYDEMALWLYSLTGRPTTPLEPPLMSWILLGAMWAAQSARPFVVHIVPIVLGVLTVPVVYRCAALLDRNDNTGWTAALLTALSPMAIYYSREGRPYAVYILLTTLLYAVFLKAYARGDQRSWTLFAVLLFLCGLTHLLTFQILLVVGLFLGISALQARGGIRMTRGRLAALGVAVALGGAWGVYRFQSSQTATIEMLRAFDGLYPFGPVSFFRTVFVNLGPGPVQAIFGAFTSSDAVAIVFVLLFAIGLRRLALVGPPKAVLFTVLLFGVPLAISYVTLGEKGAWDWARYISHLLVPFIVVCSMGWNAAMSLLPNRKLQAAALVLFVAALLPHTLTLSYRDEYATYRTMQAYLDEHRADLRGVVVLSYLHTIGAADDRITNIYLQMKREDLPVYQLHDGVIHEVTLVPGRLGISRVGIEGPVAAGPFASGRYAFLWRQPFTDCGQLQEWVKTGVKASAPADTAPFPPVMTVCELDFQG